MNMHLNSNKIHKRVILIDHMYCKYVLQIMMLEYFVLLYHFSKRSIDKQI